MIYYVWVRLAASALGVSLVVLGVAAVVRVFRWLRTSARGEPLP